MVHQITEDRRRRFGSSQMDSRGQTATDSNTLRIVSNDYTTKSVARGSSRQGQAKPSGPLKLDKKILADNRDEVSLSRRKNSKGAPSPLQKSPILPRNQSVSLKTPLTEHENLKTTNTSYISMT